MQTFNAGTLNGHEVSFKTTVHGPVVGYARVHGRTVAISRKRASYGRDVLDLLYNRRLSDGQVNSPQSFIKAAELTPQTFNSFYVDDKHVAEYTAGLLPLRPKGRRSEPADDRHRPLGVAGLAGRRLTSAGNRPAP